MAELFQCRTTAVDILNLTQSRHIKLPARISVISGLQEYIISLSERGDREDRDRRQRGVEPKINLVALVIPPGEKQKKTTGPRLSSRPKFDPIKNGTKTTSRGLPWGPKMHRNQSQPQLQLSEPKINLVNPLGEKQKKMTGPRLLSEPKFNPLKNGKKHIKSKKLLQF